MNKIDKNSLDRAMKAMKCLPFNSIFYKSAQYSGLSAENVFHMKEKYFSNRSSWFKNSDEVENDFRWLIVLGVLRREVDGQGLTSRVRLTPLGRYIIETKPRLMKEKVFLLQRLRNCIFRKFMFN